MDFFTGDDGLSLLPRLPSIQTSPIKSVDSLASIMEDGTLSMHLQVLCDYIRDHQSLSEATIVSASSYSQRSALLVKHRFLLLHLRRTGKGDVWLRLDRLRSDEKSLLGFVLSGGVVEANDIVCVRVQQEFLRLSTLSLKASVAKDKDLLIGNAKWENTQVYNFPPLLSDFRHFLLILVNELISYKAWPVRYISISFNE